MSPEQEEDAQPTTPQPHTPRRYPTGRAHAEYVRAVLASVLRRTGAALTGLVGIGTDAVPRGHATAAGRGVQKAREPGELWAVKLEAELLGLSYWPF